MPFCKIAWRNMEQRALASSLTGLSMALGVAVMICVIVIHSVTVRQFEQDAQGYHLIVGGKSGPLQLVLSTVYHLGKPDYPIPYSYYQKFSSGEFADVTKLAVPYCLGDSYEAPNGKLFRVIGTTPDLFDQIVYQKNQDGSDRRYEFRAGRNFKADHFFEAVVGSVVAAQAGLQVGDPLNPTHGITGTGEKHRQFKIVGILAPTGTANDRAVFVNIEGFYLLEGHALSRPEGVSVEELICSTPIGTANDGSPVEPLADQLREVTSILVVCIDEFGPLVLDTAINKSKERIAQAVSPVSEVARMLDRIVGPIRLILFVMTILILIVAGISILVSIYNSMSERSHDIAVMRALGASRRAVMSIILVESILLSLCGGFAGMLLGHGLIALASPYVEAHTGVTLSLFQFDWQEMTLVPGLLLLATVVGFLPALAAYRTDVAKALSAG
jgi:putative ABC transport system permease protein